MGVNGDVNGCYLHQFQPIPSVQEGQKYQVDLGHQCPLLHPVYLHHPVDRENREDQDYLGGLEVPRIEVKTASIESTIGCRIIACRKHTATYWWTGNSLALYREIV